MLLNFIRTVEKPVTITRTLSGFPVADPDDKRGWTDEFHQYLAAGGMFGCFAHDDRTRTSPFWMHGRESCIHAGPTGV
jgi:hypothetical protein